MYNSQADDAEAQEIYQDLLDKIAQHFWARDWVGLEPCFMIPNRVSSKDAERVFDDYTTWTPVLNAARDSYDRIGAKEYHRLCRGAHFTNDNRTSLTGQHITYIMRDAQFVIPPYMAYLTAVYHDGHWRAASLHTDKRDADLPTIHPELRSPPEPRPD
ncbi:hypothetical protein [Antarctobacter jejuensis]|uniref:hypothetical protein n=1 Tax=Antarctobacter jejuensis TaxID=1439938 RepID=UPI003FCEF600